MTHRPDHFEAGRQLLELQLAMMKGAMAFMAGSTQRIVEISLGAAAPGRRQDPAARANAAVVPPAQRGTAPATFAPAKTVRLPASKDYALRMQQEVDSILHAFAMVPDTADRLIRTSALLTEKPGKGTEPRVRPPGPPAPARRGARRAAAEHAR